MPMSSLFAFLRADQSSRVVVTNDHVQVLLPSRLTETISWRGVDQIGICWLQNQWVWMLIGENTRCMVPFGVQGEELFRQTVLKLPRFNYDKLIKVESQPATNPEQIEPISKGMIELWNRKLI